MQVSEGVGTSQRPGKAKGLEWWSTLIGLVSIVIGMALSSWLSGPPQVREGMAAAGTFSVDRAMTHVREIAQQPHPTGTKANARVRDYLVAQLRAMGFDVRVQRELSLGPSQFAWVENVVGVLPGANEETGKAQAVLLMTHYDSTPWGPGAADDGAGVASVLEAARIAAALDKGVRRHDLIVLLTDGEELGLMGARAFFSQDPLAPHVGTVLNFDARGSRGPALMFQPGPGSASLLHTLADTAPVANSYQQEIFKRMPNDTDFSIALEHGLPGLNFAFIDGYFDYHSPSDTAANLAPDSLQHMGDQAVAAMRAALSAPAGVRGVDKEQSYMNVTSRAFFEYPAWLESAALALATALFGFALWRSRSTAPPIGVVATARATLGLLVTICTAITIVISLSSALHQDYWPGVMLRAVSARQTEWFIAWCLIAIGITMSLLGATRKGLRWPWALLVVALASLPMLLAGSLFLPGLVSGALCWVLLRKPLSKAALVRGAYLWLLVLAWALVVFFPGAANVLVWPLLAFAISRAIGKSLGTTSPGLSETLLLALASLFSAIVLAGLAQSLDLGLGARLPAIGVVPMLLLFALSIQAWLDSRSTTIGSALAVLGGIVGVVLVLSSPFDVRHPQPNSVFVLHDGIQHADCLATIDALDDAWKREAMGSSVHALQQNNYAPEVWRATRCAPLSAKDGAVAPASQIGVHVLGVESQGDIRRLHMTLHAHGGSDALALYLPKGVDVRGVEIAGKTIKGLSNGGFEQWPRSIRGFALPDADVDMALDIGPGPLPDALLAVGLDYGLPAGLTLPPRPVVLMPQSHPYSDSTITVTRIPLEASLAGPAP
ncbi:Aminopeptidase YwaD [Dyella sp. AD56]|uniref:M28 family peptidase n=1 Tax=Dyella sp. AD56 TaxID=1528744 RepID=UPI000CB9A5A4|nr:M28 family peptidase [Dyella sp. AD56]PMQ04703.1 Aminopeptidase YwaD [Dyella sp. AD56]